MNEVGIGEMKGHHKTLSLCFTALSVSHWTRRMRCRWSDLHPLRIQAIVVRSDQGECTAVRSDLHPLRVQAIAIRSNLHRHSIKENVLLFDLFHFTLQCCDFFWWVYCLSLKPSSLISQFRWSSFTDPPLRCCQCIYSGFVWVRSWMLKIKTLEIKC